VALYFAAEKNKYDGDKDICIWAFNHKSAEGLKEVPNVASKIELVRPTKRENEFLSAQSGVLTFSKFPNELLPLDEILQSYFEKPILKSACLKKIVLKNKYLPELRKLLMREGITKAHLMPSLDNVAKMVMQSYS
jgi:hypothetical protein